MAYVRWVIKDKLGAYLKRANHSLFTTDIEKAEQFITKRDGEKRCSMSYWSNGEHVVAVEISVKERA